MKTDKRKVIYLPTSVAMFGFVCMVSMFGMLVVGIKKVFGPARLKIIKLDA